MLTSSVLLSGDVARLVAAGKRTALLVPPKSATFQVGRSYPLRAESSKGPRELGIRVRITNLVVADLHELDYRTMRKAGFKYREDLHQFWNDNHQDPGPPDAPIPTPVIVIRFHLDRSTERRYLRPGPRGGYLELPDDAVPHGAMTDEPECVPEDWQKQHSEELRLRDLGVERERRSAPVTTPLPERLAVAMHIAERKGVDISRQLGIIGKRIEAVERKIADEAA